MNNLRAQNLFCSDTLTSLKIIEKSEISAEIASLVDAQIEFISPIQLKGRFSEELRDHMSAFVKEVRSPGLSNRWLTEAINANAISVRSPIDGTLTKCSRSYQSDQQINLLFFEERGANFIVIQNVTVCDAVYVPSLNLTIVLQHVKIKSIQKSLKMYLEDVLLSDSAIKATGENYFGGVIGGYDRPYHFFYDVIPAFVMADAAGLLNKLPCIYSYPRSAFADWRELFEDVNCKVTDASALRRETSENRKFVFHIGVPFPAIPEPVNRAVESYVLKAATRNYGEAARAFLPSKESLVIWWGVTGQKRSWLEQVGAGVEVLNSLRRQHGSLTVVFDGWTAPLDPGEEDRTEIANDQKVIDEICDLLTAEIQVRSVLGMHSLKKIAVASLCDAFVANYATGSIHVARFAKRPGVGHLNTRMKKIGHIHSRTLLVPDFAVTDVVENQDQRSDYVSYSINKAAIELLLNALLSSIEAKSLFVSA